MRMSRFAGVAAATALTLTPLVAAPAAHASTNAVAVKAGYSTAQFRSWCYAKRASGYIGGWYIFGSRADGSNTNYFAGMPRVSSTDQYAVTMTIGCIQLRLNDNGIATSVDGSFGPGTRASVIKFQRSHGLSADGVVGIRTARALKMFPFYA